MHNDFVVLCDKNNDKLKMIDNCFMLRECLTLSHVTRNLFMPYANNKGTDQPAHPRSLISTFIVRCLDSIIPIVSILAISCL